MRFITFQHCGTQRAGVLHGDASSDEDVIFDLAAPSMCEALGGIPAQVDEIVVAGIDQIAAAITQHGLRNEARLTLGEVSLMAPIPRPKRILGIAHNYRDAIRERGIPEPKEPVVFTKLSETVIGPYSPVVLPAGIGGVTYEAELAVVIGTGGSNISKAEALSHIAAVGVFNDVSASELIRSDGCFDRGKNLPTFGPFGPFLATLDEVGDLQNLAVRFELDGTVLQNSNTQQMLFGVADLIAYLSCHQNLEAGDIIATGSPAGVAPTRQPPTWLYPGSVMSATVERLGVLCNPVIEEGVFHG